MTMSTPLGGPAKPSRLMDRLRLAMRARHYSPRTETAYLSWVRRFILFHGKRHPTALGAADVNAYLAYLASSKGVSASTQNQALSALLFLYRDALEVPLGDLGDVVRARRPTRLPVVLTRAEVRDVLRELHGVCALMAALLYGSGLRLLECCRVRVKDLDVERGELVVRRGKGDRDRVTRLPVRLREPILKHREGVKVQHQWDLAHGAGSVALPGALGMKYPSAPWEWSWQWVFPATRLYRDRATGRRRRHHLHESVLQRAFKEAVRRSRISKRASCHTLRHSSLRIDSRPDRV